MKRSNNENALSIGNECVDMKHRKRKERLDVFRILSGLPRESLNSTPACNQIKQSNAAMHCETSTQRLSTQFRAEVISDSD